MISLVENRILKVYFNTSEYAEYNIFVDEVPVEISKNNFSFPQYYFQFQTSVDLHGSSAVRLNVTKGSITLVRCTATYPAVINDKYGNVTMQQPIQEPIGLVRNRILETKKFPITITNDFSYQHIMFNGPTLFKVKSKQYYNNLYIGDVLDGHTHPDIENLEPVYNYSSQPNDIFSKADLQLLHNKVKSDLKIK